MKRKNEDNVSQVGRNVRKILPNNKSEQNFTTVSNNNKTSNKSRSVLSQTPAKKKVTESLQTRKLELEEVKTLREENIVLSKEIEEMKAERKRLLEERSKLREEKRRSMLEKGTLMADVCQMEHRLACEEARVVELEEIRANCQNQLSILNGENIQLDRDRDLYRNELNIANEKILTQTKKLTEQQSFIDVLTTKLQEQEKISKGLRNSIEKLKAKQ
ncbi:6985_t:CDS:1 [Cetraspora pellucida]|uniref:6985_t:CDS:1 n=1 Tax=Cetraspora pellucida TaxID=1433469 RepID=A0ACA9L3Z4_9GLOM|nr:6985_t:CDS:1 [Cetraspora pellucida]